MSNMTIEESLQLHINIAISIQKANEILVKALQPYQDDQRVREALLHNEALMMIIGNGIYEKGVEDGGYKQTAKKDLFAMDRL